MFNKQTSTEYTGVYTMISSNKTPRELELEARVKELEQKLKIAEICLQDIATFEDDIIARLSARKALQKMEEVKC